MRELAGEGVRVRRVRPRRRGRWLGMVHGFGGGLGWTMRSSG
uniref:Uncharacterized protein n=1 Tax=Arundo donax TaxID=35708 RepID=A0A0A9H4Y1_ARUDO